MSLNIGTVDRVLRLIIGFALIGLLYYPGPERWWGFLGLIPLFTVLVGWCPLYTALGIRTTHQA